VVRLSAMGDVAMLVPVLRVLKNTYPQLQISLLSRSKMIPIFNEFDGLKVYAFNSEMHKGIQGLWTLFQELKTEGFTAIADLHYVLRSRILCLFFKGFGFKVKHLHKNRKAKKALTRATGKNFSPLPPVHYAYADVFRKLGYPIDLSTHEFPERSVQKSTANLIGCSAENQKWIGIAPFAAHAGKCYPLDYMQQVVSYLQTAHQVILFGGGSQEEAQLARWAAAYKNTHSVARFSLAKQVEVMAQLDLMLAMDSANGHLAANFGVPVVTLWGMTHPFLGFKPFQQPEEQQLFLDRTVYPKIPTSVFGNKIPKGYENAFRSLAPKTVIEKVLAVLEQNP